MANQPTVHLDDIVIRPAQVEDLPEIGALWEKLVSYHAALDASMPRASIGGADRYADRIGSQLDDPYSRVIVATHDGRLVAFVIGVIMDVTPDMFEPETNGFLADIFVEEAYRGTGVGRHIVSALGDWFKSRGVTRMEWYVAARNDAGRAFWQSLGGREVMLRMRLDL